MPRTATRKESPAVTPASAENLALPPEDMLRMLETMLRIRGFEERTAQLFQSGAVKGTAHSYVGEEAIAAGVCLNLDDADYIGSNHRGHGHCIAKGADLSRMMAELMGKENGYCRGLGGSMHIADLDLNILGANGIVGATMPLGVGAALAAKLAGNKQVVVAFFGDGASNQGLFHECMNLAKIWKLPMIFVCENNQYALTTGIKDTGSIQRLSRRADAYDVPGVTIDGNDAVEVARVVGEAVERARASEGPSMIEALTWRWGQHSMRANLREPRSEADMKAWIARDPIPALEKRIAAAVPNGAAAIRRLRKSVEKQINDAVTFAEAGAQPSQELMFQSVTVPHVAHREPAEKGTRELTYTEALNEAMRQEMRRDPSVFLMGEDVGETGGIFQASKGLWEEFGPERVRDTPISEPAFCGAGVGAAIAGLRPIVEVQIFDFVTLMMDMIVNQAAKFRFMNGGIAKVPVVIRGPQGGGIRMAAQHSQCLEAWFTHIPGLVVMAPSTPYDAKGLLTAAIRDDNPVIFLEHKMLYLGQTGPVPEEPYAIPIGKADIKRAGSDLTILATQAMVTRALSAAQQLERDDGISVEVIDPRTLRPLDEETILESVRKTSRLLVVHEANITGGFGAEVAAMVNEKAFDWLDAPVTRLGAPNVPIPYNDALEVSVIPSQAKIIAAARGLLGK